MLTSYVSSRHGMWAAVPAWISYLILWLIYHTYLFVKYKIKNKNQKNGEKVLPYFSRANSNYFKAVQVE